MAAIVPLLVGFLFLGVGAWILLLRIEGLADWFRPYSMSIGQLTVDGADSQAYAELMRARFDYHFRPSATMASETGFLEIVSLDAPELFHPAGFENKFDNLTLEVSGVDVVKVLRFINQIVRPYEWVIEGDFHSRPDRATLALRFSRGDKLIRTWYLERVGNPGTDKSALLQQLVDDAVFQLVYDFGNKAEREEAFRKWQKVFPAPANFPSRAAVAAYYQGRGALARYYTEGDWKDLDVALENLQALRGQMPDFDAGLQLLALALAEKRHEQEATHVYEQVRLVLTSRASWASLPPAKRRRVLSIDLLRATALAKLDTWQSTHAAVAALTRLDEALRAELPSVGDDRERAAYHELIAHTDVQLAYSYALYLTHLRDYTVADVIGSADAPPELRITPADIATLRGPDGTAAKPIVRRVVHNVARLHRDWLGKAMEEQKKIDGLWSIWSDGERRRHELATRLSLASGYAHYHMAEWEASDASQQETLFGETFTTQLEAAQSELREADKHHPNHYLVLQLLGLAYSEPRRPDKDLSLAEQYFERAVQANPFDHYGHELLADLRFRRLADRGVDLAGRATIEQGLDEAQKAVTLRESSGNAHLLWSQFLTMLLEIERDRTKRREMRATLMEHLAQAARFLPEAFKRPDPDLTWTELVAGIRQLDDDPEKERHFSKSKQDLEKIAGDLIADCQRLEGRWVNSERVFHIRSLDEKAKTLQKQIETATAANWRDIAIRFW